MDTDIPLPTRGRKIPPMFRKQDRRANYRIQARKALRIRRLVRMAFEAGAKMSVWDSCTGLEGAKP